MWQQHFRTEIHDFEKRCNSDDPNTQIQGVRMIQSMLSRPNPPISLIVYTGVVARLVQFLRCDHIPQLQREAAQLLTHFVLKPEYEDIRTSMIDHDVVAILIQSIEYRKQWRSTRSTVVQQQAIRALGGIAFCSSEWRDLVLSHGLLNSLLPTIYEGRVELLGVSAFALSHICRHRPSPDSKYLKLIIKALSTMLLTCRNRRVLRYSTMAVAFLCKTKNAQQIQAIKSSGILDRLITLLDHKSDRVLESVVRAIGWTIQSSDEETQYLIDVGVLQQLHRMLISGTKLVRRAACWAVAELTARSQKEIEAVISNNLFTALINILEMGSYECAKPALRAIINALNGANDIQRISILELGALKPFKRRLKYAPKKERDFFRKSKMIMLKVEHRMKFLLSGYSRLYSMFNDGVPHDVLGIIMQFETGSDEDFRHITRMNIMGEQQTPQVVEKKWIGGDYVSVWTLTIIFLLLLWTLGLE